MVDLHTHILPGIDDGAADMCLSLKMLEMAANNGTTDIAVTPHFIIGSMENTREVVTQQLEKLRIAAAENEVTINLYPGSEVFISPELPALIKSGSISTLNESRYILIELPMSIIPEYAESVLYEIRLLGYTPIIAHPERNMMIGRNSDILRRLISQEALSQVNASSINGLYGKKIKTIALNIIEMGLVHFVCSDTHSIKGRSPVLSGAKELLLGKFGDNMVQSLFETNGRHVLKNEVVPLWEVKKPGKRRWFDITGVKRLLGLSIK